jgi:hypothetical protein
MQAKFKKTLLNMGYSDLGAQIAPLRNNEKIFLCETLRRGQALLMFGDWGCGKTYLALQVRDAIAGSIYLPWASPVGDFVKALAGYLGVEATTLKGDVGKEKYVRKTQQELLVEIGAELEKTKPVLIIDKAQSIPVTLRNHVEQWIDRGVAILLVATLPQGRELYLKFPRWKLKPLSYWDSYRLVKEMAIARNVEIRHEQARAIASKGNGNPQLLLRAVNELSIDVETEVDAATDWIDLTPVVLVFLCLLIVLRYIGQGTNNSNLMIMGGLAAIAVRIGIMLSGKISKSRPRIQ